MSTPLGVLMLALVILAGDRVTGQERPEPRAKVINPKAAEKIAPQMTAAEVVHRIGKPYLWGTVMPCGVPERSFCLTANLSPSAPPGLPEDGTWLYRLNGRTRHGGSFGPTLFLGPTLFIEFEGGRVKARYLEHLGAIYDP